MEKVSGLTGEDEQMELPPGFRFHPTDEELITRYLYEKVLNSRFSARAIGEVDLNKVEPWDMPWLAKMGENEWYFFCVKDRKYPTGLRTNRATDAGYWKATGKDKEIYKGKMLVGMKKTLVFYRGRAPKGEKTNWVMHEYRLEGKYSVHNHAKTAKNEWAICRIFQKTSGGKKTHISGLVRLSNYGDGLQPSNLPALLDSSPYDGHTKTTVGETSHVTCFSDSTEDQNPQEHLVDSFTNPLLDSSSSSRQSSFFSTQIAPYSGNSHDPNTVMAQDQSVLSLLLGDNGFHMKQNSKAEFSQDTGITTDISSAVSKREMGPRSYEDQDYQLASAGSVDLYCLWNY